MARTKKSKPGAHRRAVAKAEEEGKPPPPPPKKTKKPKKQKNLNKVAKPAAKKSKKQNQEASRNSFSALPESENIVRISDDLKDTGVPNVDGLADADGDADLAIPSVEGPPTSAPDRPEDERVRTRQQHAETKREKLVRTAERNEANVDLANGIENAFKQKRAILVRIDPSFRQDIAKHLCRSAPVRDAMFDAVVSSPLTQAAWITQSRKKGLHGWFVLCIFTSSDDAGEAGDGLEGLLNFEHHPEMLVVAQLDSFMGFSGLAKNIDAAAAIAPRKSEDMQPGINEDAILLLDLEIKKVKEKTVELSATSAKRATVDKDVYVGNAPAKDITSQNHASAQNKDTSLAPLTVAPPAKDRRRIQPQLQQQISAPIQPQTNQQRKKLDPALVSPLIPVAPEMQPVVEVVFPKMTDAQSEATKHDELASSTTAAGLLQLTYAEQQTFQCRYLGEVEPGIPVHGCVLCGQHDHLWEICPGRTCQHCGDQDKHSSRACTKVKKCSKCREKGHIMEQCSSKLKLTSAEADCERCGDDTHFEDDCSYIWRHIIPEKTSVKKAPYLSVFCYNCAAQGHWGGDCPMQREKPRSHFDIFSAKEATKYIDVSASPTNLLKETLECVKRSQDKSTSIKGNAASRTQSNNYQARYSQQPREQPISSTQHPSTVQQHTADSSLNAPKFTKSKQANIKKPVNVQDTLAKYRLPSQAVYQAPAVMSPSVQLPTRSLSIQFLPLHTPPAWALPRQAHQCQSHVQNQSLTLPVRPSTNRGNDGYVSYQGNSRVNLPPRPRSRSPVNRTTGDYHQRSNYYNAANGYAQPSGYHDARGAFHYQPPSRNVLPPPPPDNEYGRRQTFRAVPPPPPPPDTRRTGGYGRNY